MMVCPGKKEELMKKLNFVFVHVDQMHRDAIAAYGNKRTKTPGLDRLVSEGHSFMKAYTTMPQCVPARTSWFTGRMSKEHGAPTNAFALDPKIPDLGQWLRRHGGYETVYTGKWHVHGRPVGKSFKELSRGGQGEFGDSALARSAIAFLENYSGEKPFFLSVGFMNPHDCCYAAGAAGGFGKFGLAAKIRDRLPELPGNFDYDYKRGEQKARVGRWSLLDWRYYLYEYHRMVEMVDHEIGRVYAALRASRFADNTMFIFASDHGDGAAFHGKVSKGFLYDEAWRVPTIFAWPGRIAGGTRDETHLMSGVDIPATVCDYAGVPMLPKMTVGKSLRPVFEARAGAWRDYVVGETRIGALRTAIRCLRYKTIFYADGRVQLYDMEKDPLEKLDIAAAPESRDIIKKHRAYFRDYVRRITLYRGPAVIGEGRRAKPRQAGLNAQIKEYCAWYDRIREEG